MSRLALCPVIIFINFELVNSSVPDL